MARFIVTGGAGFIGSNLVETLLGRGHSVRVLDDFSTGRRENLLHVSDWSAAGQGEYQLFEGDMCDAGLCREAVDGVDYVLHLGAIPSVPRSVEDPVRTNEVNVKGTLNMLEAARQARVKRFVFASSSSVYGESETLPKVETMPTAPISPYALQKLAGETYCALYNRYYSLPAIALRYFNVFGPRQSPHSEYAAVVPRFLIAARDGGRATVYGDGEQTRDFTYIENVVRANLLACEAPEEACGRSYNIACGDRISLNELLRRISKLVGHEVPVDYLDPRPGDVLHSLAGIDLATAKLGYRSGTGTDDGLRLTLEAL